MKYGYENNGKIMAEGGIILKSKLGVLSAILFFIGLVSYIPVLFGNDHFLLGGLIISVIGFLFALIAEKGAFKKAGLIGNCMIIFIAAIIPFIVTTFFWNEP
ncbi:hypothetical protein [Bacillus sp. J33]|uniref:hypothetical protein n=1 Tax=Bacillus sp. J33 TaxID=935836 RepID=UPI0004AEB9C4|nr:hypothetical protein [Bacillus sp. J33]